MALSLRNIFHDNMFPLGRVTRRDPFDEFFFGGHELAPANFFNRDYFNDINKTFANMHESIPNVDVQETDKCLILKAELPELNEGDVHIRLENNVLTVKGERKVVRSNEENGMKSHSTHYESFTRKVPVPEGTTEEDIKAQYSNNVLQVEVTKKAIEGPQARPIPIEQQPHPSEDAKSV